MQVVSRQLNEESSQTLWVPYEDHLQMREEVKKMRKQMTKVQFSVKESDPSEFLQSRVIALENKLSVEKIRNRDLENNLKKTIEDRDFFKAEYEKEIKRYSESSQKYIFEDYFG